MEQCQRGGSSRRGRNPPSPRRPPSRAGAARPHPAADQLGSEARLVPSPVEPGATLAVWQYVDEVFGIQRGGPGIGEWGAVGLIATLGAAYFCVSYLSLRFLRHQKR